MSKYFVLVCEFSDDGFELYFGDYCKETVMEEMEECTDDYGDKLPRRKMKVLECGSARQSVIDSKMEQFNNSRGYQHLVEVKQGLLSVLFRQRLQA